MTGKASVIGLFSTVGCCFDAFSRLQMAICLRPAVNRDRSLNVQRPSLDQFDTGAD